MQFVEIELVKDQDPETIPLCGVILRKLDGSVIFGRANAILIMHGIPPINVGCQFPVSRSDPKLNLTVHFLIQFRRGPNGLGLKPLPA